MIKASVNDLLSRLPGQVTAKYPNGEPFICALAHGTMSVELYAPIAQDLQTPHLQDELYFIQSGQGELIVNGERQPFEPGMVFFVAAGVEHRFENFTADFTTWVVFWGAAWISSLESA